MQVVHSLKVSLDWLLLSKDVLLVPKVRGLMVVLLESKYFDKLQINLSVTKHNLLFLSSKGVPTQLISFQYHPCRHLRAH